VTDPGTARKTIDSIMDKLKNGTFNKLIIVVEFGRTSTDVYNHLEIMERCLNGIVDSSVMLIVNKVPNKRKQAQIKLKENPLFDLDTNLSQYRNIIVQKIGFQISADFSFLQEDDDNDDIVENDKELERMRNVIHLSELSDFSKAKTWSELVDRVNRDIKDKETEKIESDQAKDEMKDRLVKLSSNILSLEEKIEGIDDEKRNLNEMKKVGTMRQLLLRPVIKLGVYKLNEHRETALKQLAELINQKIYKEKIFAEIQTNNQRLIEEIEKFKQEINRLNTLLTGNKPQNTK